MTEPRQDQSKIISRRCMLHVAASAAGAAAAAGLTANGALAQKTKKEAVDYQETPKGDQQCNNCMLFQPPAACLVVDGAINPQGWCKIWAKKA